jgi:hypothetical protein
MILKAIIYSNILLLGAFSSMCTTTIAQKTSHPNVLIKNMKGEIVQEIFADNINQNAIKSHNTSIVKL